MAALATTPEYKVYAGISGTSDDAAIAVYLDQASAFIARMCNCVFANASYTEKYDGDASDTLVVKNTPITALTSIEVQDSSNSYSTIDSSLYRYEASSGIIKLTDSRNQWMYSDMIGSVPGTFLTFYPQFPKGFQNVRVTYTAGYSTIPDDLKLVCFQVVDMLWNNRGQAGAFNAESIGQYSYNKSPKDEQLKDIMLKLWQWRGVVV